MIKNMYKKSLTVLCLCFSLYPTIFPMKTMEDFSTALNTPNKNFNELHKLADELSKDKKNYYQIARLVHPDKAPLEEKEQLKKYLRLHIIATKKKIKQYQPPSQQLLKI